LQESTYKVLSFAHELIQTLDDPFFTMVFHKAPWE